ncbi:MAG TPA: hypothetical protein VMH83_08815, partial [Candidatus Acidoferrum sp.]|nr:hypothetical protein [Candidatus Acidoferrum sp.]
MVFRVPTSRQVARRSGFGFAAAYRVISFSFLSWLVALEAVKLANKYGEPHPDAHDATIKSYDAGRADPPSRLDQTQDGNNLAKAGTHAEQHLKAEGATLDKPHENADLNNNSHPLTTVGSSTDPRILTEPHPSNPISNTTVIGTPPGSGSGVKNNVVDASATSANEVALGQAVGTTAPTPDTTAPTVSSVVASGSGIDGSGNGDLNAGHVVTLTINMSEAVAVTGGVPTLSFNNGGTASYTGGSGSNTLTFSYTVGAGQDTSDLAVTAFNLNGATVNDAAANNADISGAVGNPAGTLQIDTTAPTAPTIASIAPGGGGGNHWVLDGTAEANSSIAVFDGNTQLATVTASGLGAWNYTTTGLITNSSIHTFTTTASDAAGNTSGSSVAWIEGTPGADTFSFASEAQLTAPDINGNGGADTILMSAPTTLNSGDFVNVSAVQSVQLTGASTITLGADAVTAGIVNVLVGNGATSITDSSGTLNVNATALADNTALSLSGSAGFTVTGLQGDLTASGVSGALNVTAAAVASGL